MEHEKLNDIYAICSVDGLGAAELLDHIFLVGSQERKLNMECDYCMVNYWLSCVLGVVSRILAGTAILLVLEKKL